MGDDLSKIEQNILKEMLNPGAELLFNIKGMVQVLYPDGEFHFYDMGMEAIENLSEKGFIKKDRSHAESHILEGVTWRLTDKGREKAQQFKGKNG